MMSQIVQATYGHANLQFDRSAMGSLRVVSNFGDSDRGAGENTHARKIPGRCDATPGERQKLKARVHDLTHAYES